MHSIATRHSYPEINMRNSIQLTLSHVVLAAALAWSGATLGQTLSSGSTGADGAFNPAASVTLNLPPDGVFNYTTVNIPAGVTVSFNRNAANTPVTILATGDATIAGTISVNGANGTAASTVAGPRQAGSLGGPGGFSGGDGGIASGPGPTAGQGPGGGNPASGGGAYGAPTSFVTLLPLFGGSGGGGGNAATSPGIGGGGAGGGGAIVIFSSNNLMVNGAITANSGAQGANLNNCGQGGQGASGGAIRLVARSITGTGSLQANGTPAGSCGASQPGRIRLEAFTLGFGGSMTPAASQSAAPGPVTAAGTPALAALPTLAIASVDGATVPAQPAGLFGAADVAVASGTANPVTVTIALANMPVGSPTAISLKLIPNGGSTTTIAVPAANHTGTFSGSSATASVTLPVGQISVLQAWANTTLTGQIASLFPLIDGEPVERVAVALLDGRSSTLNLVTKSGRERRVDELPPADRLKVAQAWQLMSEGR